MFFCDLVGSTTLASQFDPEDWREIIGAYYDTCAKVIARFDGHIAQYLGDGLLVYFGYPRAHEDDAQRAVRAGLGIIEAVAQLNSVLSDKHGVSLAVRLGCHTGLVVVGDDVGRTGHDDMVLGDTPNIAARLEGVAAPNTLVIGALTHQLLGGLFECESLGTPPLKGVAAPLEVYRVLYESTARTRLEALGEHRPYPAGRAGDRAAVCSRTRGVRSWTATGRSSSSPARQGSANPVGQGADRPCSAQQAWFTHLPVFAVLPAHRVLPADRSAGANRPAFRTPGLARPEADASSRASSSRAVCRCRKPSRCSPRCSPFRLAPNMFRRR